MCFSQLMRNLLGTHLGHSAIYNMCRIMEDRRVWAEPGADGEGEVAGSAAAESLRGVCLCWLLCGVG